MGGDLRRWWRYFRTGPARSPSLHDIELSDAVLILGRRRHELGAPDGAQPAPVRSSTAFRDRAETAHSFMDGRSGARSGAGSKGPFFIAAPGATRLDDVATRTYRAAPDDMARLGFAVAHEIDPAAPEVVALARGDAGVGAHHRRRAESRQAPSGDFRRQLPEQRRDRIRGKRSQGFVR